MTAYQQSKIIIRNDNADGVDQIVWDVPPGGQSQVAIKRAIVNNIVAVIIILLWYHSNCRPVAASVGALILVCMQKKTVTCFTSARCKSRLDLQRKPSRKNMPLLNSIQSFVDDLVGMVNHSKSSFSHVWIVLDQKNVLFGCQKRRENLQWWHAVSRICPAWRERKVVSRSEEPGFTFVIVILILSHQFWNRSVRFSRDGKLRQLCMDAVYAGHFLHVVIQKSNVTAFALTFCFIFTIVTGSARTFQTGTN